MAMAEGFECWQCGRALDDVPLPIGRLADCPDCGAELHACRLCTSFDPRVAEQCRQPLDDIPKDKERSNFCEWFEPRPDAHQPAAAGPAQASRRALQDLFGMAEEAPPEDPAAAARRGLADLFGDDGKGGKGGGG